MGKEATGSGKEEQEQTQEMYIPYSSDGYLTLSPGFPLRDREVQQKQKDLPALPVSTVERWNTQEAHQTALEALMQRHWSVFPITAQKLPPPIGETFPDGEPKRLGWKRYQTRLVTRGELLFWQKAYSPAAWVVVTGSLSGLVVLDFDGEQGKQTLANLKLEPHLRTGSGGFHIYFKHPGWTVRTLNSKSKKTLGKRFPGMDIRADGGYAAFCGRNTQGPYHWLREPVPDELELLPEELRRALGLLHPPQKRLLTPPVKRLQTKIDPPMTTNERISSPSAARSDASQIAIQHLLEQALHRVHGEGEGRNDVGFWLACRLRDGGMLESEARDVMLEFAEHVPSVNTKGQAERYTRSEALASLRSAYRG